MPAVCVQIADGKDRLARVLADMENLRERTARSAEQGRQFAIQVRTQVPSYCSLRCMMPPIK